MRRYVQAPLGFHGDRFMCSSCGPDGIPFDWFTVVASDCINNSPEANVTVRVSAPASVGSSVVPSLSQLHQLPVGTSEGVVTVAGDAAIAEIRRRYGDIGASECRDEASHSVGIIHAGPFDLISSAANQTTLLSNASLTDIAPDDHGVVRLLLRTTELTVNVTLEVWTTLCGVTVRYVVAVGSKCLEADPLVCATDARLCVEGSVFDSDQMRCKFRNEMNQVRVRGIVAGLCVVVIVFIAISALLIIRTRRLQRSMRLIMDDAERNIDLESPLSKAIRVLRDVEERRRPARLLRSEAGRVRLLLLKASNVAVPDLMEATGNMPQDMQDFLVATATKTRVSSTESSNSSLRMLAVKNSWVSDANELFPDLSNTMDLAAINQEYAQLGVDWFVNTIHLHSLCEPYSLQIATMTMLERWNILPSLKIKERNMRAFLQIIHRGYKSNPYHGVEHAIDVTARLCAILHHSGMAEKLMMTRKGALNLLAVVIAAVVHDYEHPGVNNAFVVKQQMQPAKAFNHQAVLENHSLFHALSLMEDLFADTCLVENLKHNEQVMMRSTIISMVLATDMSKHFEVMTAFNNKVKNVEMAVSQSGRRNSVAESIKDMSEEQQTLVFQMAMKVADLGHNALPLEVHTAWLKRLQDEFYKQGDKERMLGLPVSALMDREKPGAMDPTNQVGFLSVIVVPLYTTFCEFAPACSPLLSMVRENYQQCKAIVGDMRK